jgi:hypothetical protein
MDETISWNSLTVHERDILLLHTPVSRSYADVIVWQVWSAIPPYIQDELYRLDWRKLLGRE